MLLPLGALPILQHLVTKAHLWLKKEKTMKGCWLGQMGFLFTTENGTDIMIDPYLLNSLEEKKGESFHREVEINESFIRTPNIIILTHCHDDHTNIETLDRLLTGEQVVYVLAPESTLPLLRERYGTAAEWVLFRAGTEYTVNDVRMIAHYAEHSDTCAIGVEILADGKTVYHMGDTLYNRKVLNDAVKGSDLLIVPINGKGNNMNPIDAARLTKELKPKRVFPAHWDMFKVYGCDPNQFTALFTEKDKTSVFLCKHYTDFVV